MPQDEPVRPTVTRERGAVGPELGSWCLRRRLALGRSQQQVAARAGIGVRSLRDMEQGRIRSPRAGSVHRLLTALEVPEDEREALLGALTPTAADPTAADPTGPGPTGPDPTAAADPTATDPSATDPTATDPTSAGLPDTVSIRLLGPLEVSYHGAALDVGAGKVRSLLAVLALHHGSTVLPDDIVTALWADDPPATCANLIQVYVHRLRAGLGVRGATVITDRTGYRLASMAGVLDSDRFESFRQDAETAERAGEVERALAGYRQALDCWRGPVLADQDSTLSEHPLAVALGRRRADAAIRYARLAVAAGRPGAVIERLRTVLADEPLHEALHAGLMDALIAAGDQSGALALYQQIRRRLDHELGIAPGTALGAAHRRALGPAPADDADAGRPAPRQLPPDVNGFTGRQQELAALTGLLHPGGTGDRPAPAVVISGTAGVGKTSLAVHWAHRNRQRFPDGQLYLNLRGYDPDEPLRPQDALAQLLWALGTPGPRIPATVDERSTLLRTLLDGRRTLLILDNASTEAQIRPLLPGTPTATTLITSRHTLPGLVARDGARRLPLDLLPHTDTLDLLRTLIGPRIDTEPDAARQLAALCTHLPLALRIAAERINTHPTPTLRHAITDLTSTYPGLDLLDGDDPQTGIRAILSWSYDLLPPATATLFRRLALLPTRTFTARDAAALIQATPALARRHLDRLSHTHLIQPATSTADIAGPAGARYTMHDLLHAYAAELAQLHDGPTERRAALTHFLDHYLQTTHAAVTAVYPSSPYLTQPLPTDPPADLVPVPDFTAGTARTWLDQQQPAALTIVAHAAAHGHHHRAGQLVQLLRDHLTGSTPSAYCLLVYTQALAAARAVGDVRAEALARIGLCRVVGINGTYREATEHGQAALRLGRDCDPAIEARALSSLAYLMLKHSTDVEEATRLLERAVECAADAGDLETQGYAISVLGLSLFHQGRLPEAIARQQEARDLSRATGIRHLEAQALNNLGLAEATLGDLGRAGRHFEESIALAREIGHSQCEACALTNLGDVLLVTGDPEQAMRRHRQALDIGARRGDNYNEVGARNGIADVYRRLGRYEDAVSHYRTALELAHGLRDAEEQARAHTGLFLALPFTGDRSQAQQRRSEAERHRDQALRLLRSSVLGLRFGLREQLAGPGPVSVPARTPADPAAAC